MAKGRKGTKFNATLPMFPELEPLEKSERNSSESIEESDTVKTGIVLPLQASPQTQPSQEAASHLQLPELPARWEMAKDVAEQKNVLPALLRQIKRVQALDFLTYIATMSRDEGYVWVVYGAPGSGKSAFFHTLEYQTSNSIKTHIIDGNKINLSNQIAFSTYLTNVIKNHKQQNGQNTPLVIVLEERETDMMAEERSSISQALRNVLRTPGLGSNVVFVLPVTEPGQGSLFLEQARNTGVATPVGHNQIYTFEGPSHGDHVDILSNLFVTLNDRDITEYGLQRSDLQLLVSSHQTIGEYIRLIRGKLTQQNAAFQKTVHSHNYRPFTVVMCFVNPLPGYDMEPKIKAMTTNTIVNRVRTGEILRSQSQKAQRWQGKFQALANIVDMLDIRIVEIPPHIVTKLLYAYNWKRLSEQEIHEQRTIEEAEEAENLDEIGEKEEQGQGIVVDYNAPKSVRQNLRQQLRITNLFRILAGEETQSYSTPRYYNKKELTEQEQKRKEKELAEIEITRRACAASSVDQQTLHRMFAMALSDAIQNSGHISGLSDFKAAYPEAWLTLPNKDSVPEKKIKPDIVVEMQHKLFLLEFCWRSAEHFTYSDIAGYVLRKIEESYKNLPLVRALAEDLLTD